MTRIELDRDRIEEDRFLVLLACGHWVHTRRPDDKQWFCPVVKPRKHNDGLQPAAVTTDGKRAILTTWEVYDDVYPQ